MNPSSIGIQNAGEQLTHMKATAESLFSNQLASALSTISDSQFFQDSISPTTIRSQFSSSDPSNPTSIPVLMNSMKWLLASMSKGRDVSDFFPHVVKLVSCPSLEIRKMVYTYLTHYADHDATCRDLALLSINAFQRDLSNSNDNIRPLALRVLTSIRVMDVLQIQILAVQSCSKDSSPHVRKCATNALAKLYPRSDDDNKHRLKEMLRKILMEENSTIVLSSAVVSFVEICPNELDMLHGCYRKLCHLLTDIEEWGQISCLDVLARYCRTFFRSPEASNGIGSAEKIDRQRRITRIFGKSNDSIDDAFTSFEESGGQNTSQIITSTDSKKKEKEESKKRVVKKGFYSDEEDESTDDDENTSLQLPSYIAKRGDTSLASRMRSPSELNSLGNNAFSGDRDVSQSLSVATEEDAGLDEDHRLLLNSSLPLLKSRNSGVVLGVCSLHYHCGIASIKIRSSLGKALVRIYHDRREIQYVVLNSIRMLAQDCPSAFTPYLNDFFVKATDPSFTRIIKLDILVSLCLEENSINAVLNELKIYVRNTDKAFVCASIRAIGKLVEMANIFYSRQGAKTGNAIYFRNQANQLALNCLQGIITLMQASDNHQVIGQSIAIAQQILLQLSSQESVEDPFHTRGTAIHQLLMLVIRPLIKDESTEENKQNEDDSSKIHHRVPVLPPNNIAPALWIIGEWLLNDTDSIHVPKIGNSEKKRVLSELLRLLANGFTDMDTDFKCQCVHLAGKALVSTKCSINDETLCDFILGLGRLDVNLDVRDRARNVSLIVHMVKGLKFEVETLTPLPLNRKALTIHDAKNMFLQQKPESSWIPADGGGHFRFGTLTSMVSHVTGTSYIQLPPWSKVDSSSSLRDPPVEKMPQSKSKPRSVMGAETGDGWKIDPNRHASSTFYDSDDSSDSSSSSDDDDTNSSSSDTDSGSSSASSESSSSSEASSEEDDESTSSDESNQVLNVSSPTSYPLTRLNENVDMRVKTNSSSDSSSDSSHSSDDSSTSNNDSILFTGHTAPVSSNATDDLLNMAASQEPKVSISQNTTSLISDGLEGLVMNPIIVSKDDITSCDIDQQSSKWEDVARHDLSGGLSMKIRFLRSSVRSNEATRLGLNPTISSVVCAQVMFENKRADGLAIRRIKLIQKKNLGNGYIDAEKVVLPQDILSLDSGQLCLVLIGIQFSNISDKDGAMVAKFDVKCDRGTTAIEIKLPLAEMVQRSSITDIKSFEKEVKRLSGTYQKSRLTVLIKDKDQVIDTILSSSTISLVHRWDENACRFAGKLPVSSLDLLLKISCSPDGSGEIIVYCDDAMAVNSLLVFFRDILKEL